MMEGLLSQSASLLVADADIHSGTPRTDGFGLTSDSFVLQGGDPWGFDPGAAFAGSQANGTYVFAQPVPEPKSYFFWRPACRFGPLIEFGPARNAATRPRRRSDATAPEDQPMTIRSPDGRLVTHNPRLLLRI